MKLQQMVLSAKKRLPTIMVATAFGLLIVASTGFSKVFAATPTPYSIGPKVSFTFDDGLASAYTNAAPILAKYGLTATEYVPTSCVASVGTCPENDTASFMTWAQVQALQNTYGWEVGSHTVTTPCLANDCAGIPTVTPAQIDSELVDSKQILTSNGITNPLSFAVPYGDYNNANLAEIDKYYTSNRGFQDVGYNTFPYNGTLVVDQQVQGTVTVAQVEAMINTAKANNQWLVLSFHDILPNPSLVTADYQWGTTQLDQLAAYVKAQSVPVVQVSQALPTSAANMFANGSFNSGIANGWTTDNSTTIRADQQAATTTAAGNYSAINGHGAYDGTPQGPLNSVYLSNSSSTTDSHLFSPTVPVATGTTYLVNNFVNVTSTTGEVDFVVDEYNAAGTWISDQYHTGIVGTTDATALRVGNVNFTYTPSSTSVVSARLQVVAHGAGLTAYYDNGQMYPESAIGSTTTTTPPPTVKPGDVNGDGAVNAADLSLLLSNWNKTSATAAQGDLNGDGIVNAADLSILLSNWGK